MAGTIPAGSISNELSSTIDLFPTFAEILGLALPEKKIDGVSILPLMREEPGASPRDTCYYYGQGNALEAVRKEHWKLVFPHKHRTYVGQEPGTGGSSGETSQVEIGMALYDLRRDPGERYDVQTSYPEIVRELQIIATAARRDLGDGLLNIKGKNLRTPGHFSQ